MNVIQMRLVYFLTAHRIHLTSEHASATVGKKRGRGKLEPVVPGMTIQIPKSVSGDICPSDSEYDPNASTSVNYLSNLVRSETETIRKTIIFLSGLEMKTSWSSCIATDGNISVAKWKKLSCKVVHETNETKVNNSDWYFVYKANNLLFCN